jgi:hypothetical protein
MAKANSVESTEWGAKQATDLTHDIVFGAGKFDQSGFSLTALRSIGCVLLASFCACSEKFGFLSP